MNAQTSITRSAMPITRVYSLIGNAGLQHEDRILALNSSSYMQAPFPMLNVSSPESILILLYRILLIIAKFSAAFQLRMVQASSENSTSKHQCKLFSLFPMASHSISKVFNIGNTADKVPLFTSFLAFSRYNGLTTSQRLQGSSTPFSVQTILCAYQGYIFSALFSRALYQRWYRRYDRNDFTSFISLAYKISNFFHQYNFCRLWNTRN